MPYSPSQNLGVVLHSVTPLDMCLGIVSEFGAARLTCINGDCVRHSAEPMACSPPAYRAALRSSARYDPARRYPRAQRLAPGDFPLPSFSTVLNGIAVRRSIVGKRRDLQESLEFAAEGRVRARIYTDRLENINSVFANLKNGKIDARVVLTLD